MQATVLALDHRIGITIATTIFVRITSITAPAARTENVSTSQTLVLVSGHLQATAIKVFVVVICTTAFATNTYMTSIFRATAAGSEEATFAITVRAQVTFTTVRAIFTDSVTSTPRTRALVPCHLKATVPVHVLTIMRVCVTNTERTPAERTFAMAYGAMFAILILALVTFTTVRATGTEIRSIFRTLARVYGRLQATAITIIVLDIFTPIFAFITERTSEI